MKIKLITPQREHADAWAAALTQGDATLQPLVVVQPLHMVNVLVNGSRPDLVVVETTSAREFEALEALALAHPEMEYVLIGAEMTSDVLMRAMRAGVREVLTSPVAPAAVLAAVQRQLRKRAPVKAQPVRHGEVISFVSCKGGSGATFAAANLAHILAGGGQRKVALIDMNLQFGDAALFVSSQPAVSNLADLALNIQRLDPELLLSSMTLAAPGLSVLPAPEDPAQSADVTPQAVQAIVTQARLLFDHVVIDVGRSLSAVSLQALDLSDRVYPVLQLTLPFIRDGKRLRDVFRSLDYPAQKIHWVVNRYQKDSQITLDDVKRTLAITEVLTLPNEYDVVAASVNQGVPVETVAPNSAITKALREIAYGLAPGLVRGRSGWFAGLRRGAGKAAIQTGVQG